MFKINKRILYSRDYLLLGLSAPPPAAPLLPSSLEHFYSTQEQQIWIFKHFDFSVKPWTSGPHLAPSQNTHTHILSLSTVNTVQPLAHSLRGRSCSGPTMTIREFLISYLMPEKCYQTFFVDFHPHGETFCRCRKREILLNFWWKTKQSCPRYLIYVTKTF